MVWLTPSIVASLTGTLILLAVYLYLYSRYRERQMALWTGAWAARALRFAATLAVSAFGATLPLLLVQHAANLASAYLLLAGTGAFLGVRISKVWAVAAAAVFVWVGVGAATKTTFIALNLPEFAFLSGATVWAGISLLRHPGFAGPWKHATGWSLVLWGVHIADYPFLRTVQWFAPWGYLIAGALSFSVAVGILLVYFEQARAETAASEARFRLLAENARDVIFRYRLGPDPCLEYVSPSVVHLTGYSPAQHYAEPGLWLESIPPEGRPLLAGLEPSPDRSPETLLLPWTRRDGARLWAELHLTSVRGVDGALIAVEGIARDVTARKKAEDALAEAHQFLQTVVDGIAEPILVIGTDHAVRLVNRAARELSRTDSRASGIKRCYSFSHGLQEPCEEPGQDCPLRAVQASGRPVTVTHVHRSAKGDRILEILASPISDDSGRFLGIVQSTRDITDRVTAEKELDAEKRRLSVTLDSISDAVIAADERARITLMNPAASRLAEWPVDQAVGRPVGDVLSLLDPRSGRPLEDPARRAALDAKACAPSDDQILRTKSGEERLVSCSASPILDSEGKSSGTVVTVRDVSQARRLQQELAKAEQIESLGLLAGGIAHDFNNILMAIAGNMALARKSLPPGGKGCERLLEAENACFRATDLTQQLLTFARGGEPVRTTFSFAPLLQEWASFALRGSNVRAEVEYAPDLAPVDADEGQIRQVISNLVINAQQAMPQGGVVRIQAENVTPREEDALPLAQGVYVRISVQDSGVGIPPGHRKKIFSPYFTTKQAGSGLGLATSYSIARRHGGHVAVSSRLGAGSIFRLYLPVSEKMVLEPQTGAAGVFRGKGRVLVMDDEEMLRDLLAQYLPELGYEPELAADGAEAVGLYRQALDEGRPFEAVLLDLTVPAGMGGEETLRELLKIDPTVKAIASSGYAADAVLADCKRYGFAQAIAKPYRPDELARVLHDTLQTSG